MVHNARAQGCPVRSPQEDANRVPITVTSLEPKTSTSRFGMNIPLRSFGTKIEWHRPMKFVAGTEAAFPKKHFTHFEAAPPRSNHFIIGLR